MTEIPKEELEVLREQLLATINAHPHSFPRDVAHIEIHGNQVLGMQLVEGLEIKSVPFDEGVEIEIYVKKGFKIEKPVQFCFGVIPDNGTQHIISRTIIEESAKASFVSNCSFPNAVNVKHIMDATITLEKGAELSYFERHIHGSKGGVDIIPTTRVVLKENAYFKTEFELIKGAAGKINIDYQAECGKNAKVEMLTRIFGRLNDEVHIREAAHLLGDYSVGVLTSHIAMKNQSAAVVENELIADAPFVRGHVDCKEIIQDNAKARAIPIVEVNDHRAHVTHEAAIGSVDSKQLQTLMTRGLNEEEATDLIIQGLLT